MPKRPTILQMKRQKLAAVGLLATSFEGRLGNRVIVAFKTPGNPKPGDIRNGLDVEYQGGGHPETCSAPGQESGRIDRLALLTNFEVQALRAACGVAGFGDLLPPLDGRAFFDQQRSIVRIDRQQIV